METKNEETLHDVVKKKINNIAFHFKLKGIQMKWEGPV